MNSNILGCVPRLSAVIMVFATNKATPSTLMVYEINSVAGDTADAGACVGFQSIPVSFGISGVNNIDLQIAIQYASGGSASASSGSVTLYFQ